MNQIIFSIRQGDKSCEWALGTPVDIASLQQAIAVAVEAFENNNFEEMVEVASLLQERRSA